MKTLLDAARKAYPDRDYQLDSLGAYYIGPETLLEMYFNIEDGTDQMALQIALEDHKNGGWTFWRTEDGTFAAESWDEGSIHFAPTKAELLLAIARQGDS